MQSRPSALRCVVLVVGLLVLASVLCVSGSAPAYARDTAGSIVSDTRTPTAHPKTLVVLDDNQIKQTHSAFFEQMSARGHQLTFAIAGEDTVGALKLHKYGAFFYDNLVILCSQAADLGEVLSIASVQTFVDSGRSVLIGVDERVSEAMRELVSEFGFDIDEEGTQVQDHAQYDVTDQQGLHTLVLSSVNTKASRIISGVESPVLFRGIGHVAQASERLSPVLTGSATAFSYAVNEPVSEFPSATGSDVLLVSALQTAGNARIVFSGSLALFSNELIYHSVQSASAPQSKRDVKSGNEEFVRSVSMWCFQERGLLRARDLTHHKIGAEHDVSPTSYRVSDHISFSVVIEEYDGITDKWLPYSANDVQLELTMLDPYLRVPLKSLAGGRFTTDLQVPDVYGVYKFVISYHRIGYGNLEVSSKVSVHPFRHDEYERFIDVAYPYYAGTFSIMAAFFIFGALFLYHKE